MRGADRVRHDLVARGSISFGEGEPRDKCASIWTHEEDGRHRVDEHDGGDAQRHVDRVRSSEFENGLCDVEECRAHLREERSDRLKIMEFRGPNFKHIASEVRREYGRAKERGTGPIQEKPTSIREVSAMKNE